jgi:hypothetical protein
MSFFAKWRKDRPRFSDQIMEIEMQVLNMEEIEQVDGGVLPLALFFFDVAILSYDIYLAVRR